MTIPRVIHQTWKDSKVPEHFADYVKSWRDNHPDWKYRLWTDEDNRALIAREFPWFLETYDAYPAPIQRADAVRYFILYKFGGMYVDLDFVSRRAIDPLLQGQRCVLGLEPEAHRKHFNVPSLVCNALMAVEPEHPFFERVIAELPKASSQPQTSPTKTGTNDEFLTTLATTGPLFISKVYEDFTPKSCMNVLEPKYLYPLTLKQATDYRLTNHAEVDLSDSYAVHMFYGSWWKPSSWDQRRFVIAKFKSILRSCTPFARHAA